MTSGVGLEPLTPERRRQQTREYLIQAAAEVFSERGFHGASLDEVAARAGFTKGAVYSNFKSKEDLFLALLESRQRREAQALRDVLDSSAEPPGDRLYEFVALVRDQAAEQGVNWAALYQEFCSYALGNPEARSELAGFDAAVVESVAGIIEVERKHPDVRSDLPARHVARIVIALFRGLDLMRLVEGDAVDESLLESAMSFVARALMEAPPIAERAGTLPPAR